MAEPIKSVTILGGGTAGWLAAALIQNAYGRAAPDREPVEVTLIESPNVPTVGVGEATVPLMGATLRALGIPEKVFFKHCNASFKTGVLFGNWNVDENGDFVSYINPFARVPTLDGVSTGSHFLRYGAGASDFISTFCPANALLQAGKAPRALGGPEYDPGLGYAYHLDAGKFANLLRDICTKRGVIHVLDDMIDVEQDERGYISALLLKEQGRHPVEFILDCTGFRGLLINKVLEEPFEDYARYLGNDRALAVQIPHRSDRIDPVTKSTALGAGWVWRVPLYHRIGTGYVFSSAHRTDEAARAEFLAHLGPEGEGAEPRAIPMRVGRTRRAWVKNCVAVGLSSGFIEPLESTAIHMIDASLRWLVRYWPDSEFRDAPRDRFNKLGSALYGEVRDFICLHYRLGNRTDDPYWIDARTQLEIPDTLAENLELWERALPATFDLPFAALFTASTYEAVLLGKRVYDTGYGDRAAIANRAPTSRNWLTYLGRIEAKTKSAVAQMPDHRTLLAHLRGEAEAPFAVAKATVPLPDSKALEPANAIL